MNAEDQFFVMKWGLSKTGENPQRWSGRINKSHVQVKEERRTGRRFLKDVIPVGYSICIDKVLNKETLERLSSESKPLSLKFLNNLFESL